MTIPDLWQETYSALVANKSRSALTILGIVIGIASVITMVAVGQGATSDITANIQSLGSNLLMVSPGAQRGVGSSISQGAGSAVSLTLEDAQAIESEVASIKSIAPTVSTRKQVTAKGTNTNTSIYGVDANYPQVRNLAVEQGVFITQQQTQSMAKVAVLGPTTRDDLFGENADCLGKKIKIGGQEFTVIGVTESKGGTGFGNADDLIYVPLKTAQHYLVGSQSLGTINIEAESEEAMDQVKQEITALLLLRHKIADASQADFTVTSQADIIDTVSSVSQTLTLLLGAIAGISLLVGGIGIMNMMLTTVTERTKEIGLRKSLGAKRKDISLQFLSEAVALTFIGGILGVALGWAASLVVGYFGVSADVSLLAVALAVCVSGAIGIVFGYYPARRAAKMDPIQALRYE